MTTDLEADLRQEFDAASAPSSLTFNPDAVLRQGSRTIRRRRLVAVGSCAAAVALVATGATLMSGSTNTATPQPATRTTAPTGIVRASVGQFPVTGQVEINRDPRVRSNVRFFAVTDDRKPRREVASASLSRPGQKPEAIWRSGMVDGHPYTFGLVPGKDFEVTLAAGAPYGITFDEVKGTDYSAFSVVYKNGDEKEPNRPAKIASITWAGPDGIVDGIEGADRVSGRVLRFDSSASEKLVLRTGKDGRTTVSGHARLQDASGGYSTSQPVVAADDSGVAIVSGRYPVNRRVTTKDGVLGRYVGYDGAPIAAGILPPGASKIGVLLTAGEDASPLVVSERLPDGMVVFALKAESARASQPSEDSIRAVTWTNADGSKGHQDVTQESRKELPFP